MAFGAKTAISLSLAVVIAGGGGYAAYNVMNSDINMEKVVPSNALAFASFDGTPSLSQGKSALDFIDRVNKAIPDKDKKDELHLTGEHFDGLNKERIDSWLGDNITWIMPEDAIPESTIKQVKKLDMGNASKQKTPDLRSITIYESKDNKRAQIAIDAVKAKNKQFFYVLEGKFVYVTDSEDTYNQYKADLQAGNITETESYKNDKKLIDDNVGYAWFDIGGIAESIAEDEEKKPAKEITGRVISALSFEDKGLNIDTKFVDFTFDGKIAEKPKQSQEGLKSLEAMPENTFGAIGISGLSDGLEESWGEIIDEAKKTQPEILKEVKNFEKDYEVKLPKDFRKIFGNNTSFGLTTNEKMYYIADGGEAKKLNQIVKKFADSKSGIKVTGKDSLTIISNGKADYKKTLKDNKLYQTTLPDAGKSDFAFWLNIGSVFKQMKDSTPESKKLGAVGITGSHDYDNNVTSVKTRWVLPD